MAAVNSEEEQFHWLDNSFVSAGMKYVDKSHSAKRNCSALPRGKRKTAKLRLCSMQTDNVNNISVDHLQQAYDAKCVSTHMKRLIASPDAGENKNAKAISQLRSPNDSHVVSAADGNDELHSFSEQDQLTTSLVFSDCSFELIVCFILYCSGHCLCC